MNHHIDHLTAAERATVLAAGTPVHIPKDWSLIWERTSADRAYLIVSGEVIIKRKGQEVARLADGDVVGESAIVNHRLRSATVVAATPLEVVHFSRETVERLCLEIPAFRAALDAAAGERLETTA